MSIKLTDSDLKKSMFIIGFYRFPKGAIKANLPQKHKDQLRDVIGNLISRKDDKGLRSIRAKMAHLIKEISSYIESKNNGKFSTDKERWEAKYAIWVKIWEFMKDNGILLSRKECMIQYIKDSGIQTTAAQYV